MEPLFEKLRLDCSLTQPELFGFEDYIRRVEADFLSQFAVSLAQKSSFFGNDTLTLN